MNEILANTKKCVITKVLQLFAKFNIPCEYSEKIENNVKIYEISYDISQDFANEFIEELEDICIQYNM